MQTIIEARGLRRSFGDIHAVDGIVQDWHLVHHAGFALGGLGICGLVGSYFVFDHVSSRIDRFLDPSSGDSYQVDKGLEAFMNGESLGYIPYGSPRGDVQAAFPDVPGSDKSGWAMKWGFSLAGEGPQTLTIEVTERVLLSQHDAIIKTRLAEMSSLGIGI